ncbi:hypothetical protein Mal64_22670 [Pseudobythopirellula maris]|uniref:Uncharacterized protein n=1 Tax=Pseudobythopirellula maris TaxID=2527991 RepID=A0A5C5ZMW7_9BACT|nr:hypothetical protein [Pseudobythopirellula maris]TWT88779.1 hypothetical protein Mal64_22670 [Pseudobythopirellula maris]
MTTNRAGWFVVLLVGCVAMAPANDVGVTIDSGPVSPPDDYAQSKAYFESRLRADLEALLAYVPGVVVRVNVDPQRNDGFKPPQAMASIVVPRNYCETVWRSRHITEIRRGENFDEATVAEEQAVIMKEVKANIEDAVAPLLYPPSEERKLKRMVVTFFEDLGEAG